MASSTEERKGSMAHKKRLCRLSRRTADRMQRGKAHMNYDSDASYKKAKRRRQLEKAGRKAARKGR